MRDTWKFSFVTEECNSETEIIDFSTKYDMSAGYGFSMSEAYRNEDLRDSWPGEYFKCVVKTFLVDVPYGNYVVSVVLGDKKSSSSTTVKAGLGQLMLYDVVADAGQFVNRSFAINVDDGQLKLAFAGENPKVRSIHVERTPDIPTLFMAGDSTMSNQPSGGYPYTGWGQMLGNFFTSGIAISNHARSGRSSKSFILEGRLNRMWKRIHQGDYLFVQFAHNDEKDNEGGTHPYTTYKDYLRKYIEGARQRGATPVLVSPIHRRFFDEIGRIENTHGDYIDAMQELAIEEGVCYMDLASKTKDLFEELGVERTKRIFTWIEPHEYSAFSEPVRDNTHFSEYGGVQVARMMCECIRESDMEALKSYLRPDD